MNAIAGVSMFHYSKQLRVIGWGHQGPQLPTPLPRGAMSESMGRWTAVICRT
jgi:hypothetical protein